MSDDEDFQAKLRAHKPKKKKLAVPKEFLEGANNYDAKLAAIKIVAEREKFKVLLILKQMLKPAVVEKVEVEVRAPEIKKPEPKPGLLDKLFKKKK